MASQPVGSLVVQVIGDSAPLSKAITEMEDRLKSFSSNLAGITASIGEAFAVGALGKAAVEISEKFDSAFRTIANRTGATQAQLEELESNFKHLYQTSAQSAEQISQALGTIAARTGLTGQSLENLTGKMLQLAKVTSTDVQQLVPLVTRLFGDWSIAVNKQAGAMDYLRTVSQRTGVGVDALAERVVQFGAPLRGLGYSFDQATALIAKFEREGVNSDLVLGGMKAALNKFASEGIANTAGAFQDLIQRIRATDTAHGQLLATQVVGVKRAADFYRAVVEGRFDIDASVKSMKEATAASSDQAAKIPNLAKQWELFKHQVDLALEPLGKPLVAALSGALDKIKPLVQEVGDLAEAFGRLPGPVQNTLIGLTALSVSIPLVATGLRLVKTGVDALNLSTAVGTITNISYAIRNNLVGALSSTELAVMRVGAAAAIIASGFILWNQLKSIWQELGQLGTSWQQIREWLKVDVVMPSWTSLKDIFLSLNPIFGTIKEGIETLVEASSAVGRAIKIYIVDAIHNIPWHNIVDSAMGPFGALKSLLRGIIDDIEFITGRYRDMAEAASAQNKRLLPQLPQGWESKLTPAPVAFTAPPDTTAAQAAMQRLAQDYSALGIETNKYRNILASLADLWRQHGAAIGPVVGDYQILYSEYARGNVTLGGFIQSLQTVGRQLNEHAEATKLPKVALAELNTQLEMTGQQLELLNTKSQMAESIFTRLSDPIQHFDRDVLDMAQAANDALQRIGVDASALDPQLLELQSDMMRLGVVTQASLDDTAKSATDAYNRIKTNAQASFLDVQRAFLVMVDAQVKAGEDVSQETIGQYHLIKNSLKQDLSDTTADFRNFANQVNSALTSDLSSAFSDLITRTQSIGDAFSRMGQNIVRIITQQVLNSALKPLLGTLDSVIQKAGGFLGFGKAATLTVGTGGGKAIDPGIAALTTAVTGNTAAHGISTAATTVNTTATVADTTATVADTAATSVNVAAQIAAMVSQTAATVTDTAVSSTIMFPSEIGNTVATDVNTAALVAAAAAFTAASATSGAGGIFGALAMLFLQKGGIVPSAARGMITPSSGGDGGIPAILHPREMVLPADLSEGVQNMVRGSRDARAKAAAVAAPPQTISSTSNSVINIHPGAIIVNGVRDSRMAANEVMRQLPRMLKGYSPVFQAQ